MTRALRIVSRNSTLSVIQSHSVFVRRVPRYTEKVVLARIPVEFDQCPVFELVHRCDAVHGWIAFDGIEESVSDRFVDPEERYGSVSTRDERFEFDGRRPSRFRIFPSSKSSDEIRTSVITLMLVCHGRLLLVALKG